MRDITPENMVRLYEALERPATGKVAVKLSTGEPGGHNFLKPELIKDLVQKVDDTIVECNTAYGGGLQVVFRAGASAAVGGVALDDRAADLGHDLLYQLRFEVIVPARFARRELDGDLSRRGTFQRFVDAHHVLRRNLADEVYFGGFGLFAAALSRSACRERQDRQQCDHIHSIDHVDWIYLRNR